MCHSNSHLLLKYLFGFACALCKFLCQTSQFAPEWSISYFQPILAAIFVAIATIKEIHVLAFIVLPPYEEKIKSCFHQFLLIASLEALTKCKSLVFI